MKINIPREKAESLVNELQEMYNYLKTEQRGTKKFNSVSANLLYCSYAKNNLCKTIKSIVFEYFFVHLTFDEMEKYPTIIYCNELTFQLERLHSARHQAND